MEGMPEFDPNVQGDANAQAQGDPNMEGGAQGAAPDAMRIPLAAWRDYKDVEVFDIVNGDEGSAKTILIKATIPESYKWVTLGNLNAITALKCMDGFIMSHYLHLRAHQPAGKPDALVRKMAICLGVARAVTTAYYRISAENLIAGEVAAPVINVVYDDVTGDPVEYTAAPTLSVERRAILNAFLANPLSSGEQAAVAELMKCAAGLIPMQGYSLVMTNHHYLTDNKAQSRKVFAVVEKAYWKGVDVSSWFNDDEETIRDVLWHKACHPVSIALKMRLAGDDRIPKKLVAMGAGACASRLPVVESDVRAAKTFYTLIKAVEPMLSSFGGCIDYGLLHDALEAISLYPIGVDFTVPPAGLPESVPQTCLSRAEIRHYLGRVTDANAAHVATAYGFFCAMMEADTGMSASGAGSTLLSSHSLTKLKNQSTASYIGGRHMYSDYAAARESIRKAGQYVPPIITFRLGPITADELKRA